MIVFGVMLRNLLFHDGQDNESCCVYVFALVIIRMYTL